MPSVGNLTVQIRAQTRDFDQAVRRIKRGANDIGVSFRGIRDAGLAVGAVGAGIAFVGKQVFDLGSAVAETQSKFETVFGRSTESVQEFIDDFGVMAGLSQKAAKEIVATTGAIAQGMGFAQDASAGFSAEIVRLAGDLASFNNLPTEEAARAIQSALTGERESLKRLGIVILETDVQQRALINTGKENAKSLTQQEKATATLQLITERAGVAVGDLARTQDSAANRAKQLRAEFANIAQDFSTKMLPVLIEMIPVIERLAEKFATAASKAAEFLATAADAAGLTDPFERAESARLRGTSTERLRSEASLVQRFIEEAKARDRDLRLALQVGLEAQADRAPGRLGLLEGQANPELLRIRQEILAQFQRITQFQLQLEAINQELAGRRAAGAGGGGGGPALGITPPIGPMGLAGGVSDETLLRFAGLERRRQEDARAAEQIRLEGLNLRGRDTFEKVEQLPQTFVDLGNEAKNFDAAATVAVASFTAMAQAAIIGSAQMEQAVLTMFGNIASAYLGGPLGALVGGVFGIFGALVGGGGRDRPVPVRVEDFSDRAIRKQAGAFADRPVRIVLPRDLDFNDPLTQERIAQITEEHQDRRVVEIG